MAKYIAIGAGPTADLITLRGYRALQSADVVLYDKLIDQEVLSGLNAKLINVGKIAYSRCVKQEEINKIIRENLQEGSVVARLKGGDSVIFSRIVEELAVAHDLGVEVEVIPGVTAASAVAASINGALTERVVSSGVAFITGHTSASKKDGMPEYDWKALVDSKLTLVIYMGVKYITDISQNLIAAGMAKNTPVLIAYNAQSKEEEFTFTDLQHLKNINGLKNPSVFMIGEVVNCRIK